MATRALALGAFAVAVAAAIYAVRSAVDRGDETTIASFGAARIARTPSGDGRVCFTVSRAGVLLKRSCVDRVDASEIAYVLARRRSGQLVVGGIAGESVTEVRLELAPSGIARTVVADGAFYVPVPRGKTVKTVASS